MHVKGAREAVHLLDGVDSVGYLDMGLLELCDMSRFLEQQETAASNMGNRKGRWKIFLEDSGDFLEQVLAKFWPIGQADSVEFGYVDESGRVIVPIQAICVGVAQAGHDHAPVVEEACFFIGNGCMYLVYQWVMVVFYIVEAEDDARHFVILIDWEFVGLY